MLTENEVIAAKLTGEPSANLCVNCNIQRSIDPQTYRPVVISVTLDACLGVHGHPLIEVTGETYQLAFELLIAGMKQINIADAYLAYRKLKYREAGERVVWRRKLLFNGHVQGRTTRLTKEGRLARDKARRRRDKRIREKEAMAAKNARAQADQAARDQEGQAGQEG